MKFNLIFWIMFIPVILLPTIFMLPDLLLAMTGINVTQDNIDKLDKKYCELRNSTIQYKIIQGCTSFGCSNTEIKICADGFNEYKIDRTNNMYCELSLYHNILGCKK